ncbi:hypothetical protein GDO81_025119 [Engystomops pustulosus]|uniref:Olfactory receptor n=1 Tax=Engystomops pustulosus TaxID=76066 RepID=A0AAV6ZMH8_ENGPU|nr:hypothetical protein GDO81_025119 [Engystomops pustulosus]
MTNNITFIILLGFPNLQNLKFPFFSLLLLVYCGTVSGNILIMVLYSMSKTLQSPMYFFITQLSLCDLLVTTDIVPVLLHNILYGGSTISLIGCIIEFSTFASSDTSECLLLSVMSYDRYLAICNPLRYHSIMNHMFCMTSVMVIWLFGFVVMLFYIVTLQNLHFCGTHVIDHFFCDIEPIMKLSCSNTSIVHTWNLLMGSLVTVVPFIVIVMSYVSIAIAILRIPTNTGRSKAFSTCSSHLIVVTIFYGTLIIVYILPSNGKSLILNKVLALMYTVLIPLLNPIIYSMKNKDFKEASRRLRCKSFNRAEDT